MIICFAGCCQSHRCWRSPAPVCFSLVSGAACCHHNIDFLLFLQWWIVKLWRQIYELLWFHNMKVLWKSCYISECFISRKNICLPNYNWGLVKFRQVLTLFSIPQIKTAFQFTKRNIWKLKIEFPESNIT